MKVCEICGDEIYTKDGDNRCDKIRCQDASDVVKKKRKRRTNYKHDIMLSLGLERVVGELGGVYYE